MDDHYVTAIAAKKPDLGQAQLQLAVYRKTRLVYRLQPSPNMRRREQGVSASSCASRKFPTTNVPENSMASRMTLFTLLPPTAALDESVQQKNAYQ